MIPTFFSDPDLLVLGTGAQTLRVPPALAALVHAKKLAVEVASTVWAGLSPERWANLARIDATCGRADEALFFNFHRAALLRRSTS